MITKSGHDLSMTIAFRVPWALYEEAGRIAEELAGENLSEAHRMIYRRGLEALREEEAAVGGWPNSGAAPARSSARSGRG